MSIIANPEQYRKNIVLKLQEIIGSNADKTVAENVEKGIYNYAIREATAKKTVRKWNNPFFVLLYKDRLRSIYRNINPEFVARIVEGEITMQQLSNMTHLEINPSQWKELLDLKLKNDINKYRNTTIHASTDMYQCKKCKSKKCYYYELQIRGGDEASTIFVECSQCGKHWKEN